MLPSLGPALAKYCASSLYKSLVSNIYRLRGQYHDLSSSQACAKGHRFRAMELLRMWTGVRREDSDISLGASGVEKQVRDLLRLPAMVH